MTSDRHALRGFILRLAGGTSPSPDEPDAVFRSFAEAMERLVAPGAAGPKIRLPAERSFGGLR